MSYKKSYSDFLGKELILRKDNFESIAIVRLEKESGSTLFTNHPSGNISFEDSTVSRIQSKSMFEWDSGEDRYIVFTSFLTEQDKTQIYLLGFVKRSALNRQKQEVSIFTVTTALILVTLMILGLPLLKLQVMSSAERLGAKDVFLAGASLVIGPMVIILFFLQFTTNIFTDKGKEREKLEALNNQLAENFQAEIVQALRQLKIVKKELDNQETDFLKKHDKILDLLCKDLQNCGYEHGSQVIINSFWVHPFCRDNFPYFNSIFWANDQGEIGIYLSSEKEPQRINSLSHRRYVMDIIQDKGILFNGDTIAFESIRSVTDGNYELGLGIASGNNTYPTLATSFSSVSMMDPVLEEGYGFCFFNEEGRTLFHSNIQRNLNENFLEETGGMLDSYVRSGQTKFTAVRYMGMDHYVYVQQVPGLQGYYIATFLDKSYSYSPNAIALNTTAEMEIAFLILLFLIYLPLFAVTRKKRKLKQKTFVLYWLRPLLDSKHATMYKKMLFVNTIIMVYLILSLIIYQYISGSPVLLILSVVMTGLSLVMTNFFFISRSFPNIELVDTQYGKGGSLMPFWSIVLAYIILWIITKLMIIHPHYDFFKLWDILILVICIAAYTYRRGAVAFARTGSWEQLSKSIVKSEDPYLNYKIYNTSLILLLSIIPTLIFFSINYRAEQEILFKQKAHSLVERTANWRQVKSAPLIQKRQEIAAPTVEPLDGFIDQMEKAAGSKRILTHLIKIDSISQAQRDSIPLDSTQRKSTEGDEGWYDQMRVEFDKYGTQSQGYIGTGKGAPWSFDGQSFHFPQASTTQTVSVSIGSFKDLFVSNWWGMLLFFALLMLISYMLIGLVAEKIYGLDFKGYAKMIRPRHPIEISKKLIEAYQGADLLNDSFNNSFIVGVNASHVYEIYHQLRRWKTDGFYSIELLDLPNLIEKFEDPNPAEGVPHFASSPLNFRIPVYRLVKNAQANYAPLLEALHDKHARKGKAPLLVYIEHFEYAYDDEALNNIKLNILQRLVSNPSIRIVISSEISPTKIFEFYEERIKKASAIGLTNLENIERLNGLKSTFKQWQHLLGGFYRITIPLTVNDQDATPRELSHGQYLNRIKIKYAILFDKKFAGDDNHILNVQETSFTYYYAIWNSLTKEERYIIFDIAHDRFVNANNVDGIIDLLHKGLLVYDHSLHLMNESFTNFVLTKVSSDEALERELESNKKGNWSTASAVLILVIISLIAFISFGRVNILQDVNALLTSLAAIIAVFLRLGGMFVTGKSKE
ncbi:MAG TPA: hypothetical protein VK014_04905 [Cyclobacteriaceae bacterium]|nr:hypothetical protein [Cyclobacteriaceae bacterium]